MPVRSGQEFVTEVDRKRGPDERCFGTHLILGGAHDPQWRDALARIEAPAVAFSFPYFFNRASDPSQMDALAAELVEMFRPYRFVFMESGADSLYRKPSKARNIPAPEVFRSVYHDFLNQFRDAGIWTVAGEFDVWDSDSHRAEGLLELAETGVEIVPVIHSVDVSGPQPTELTPEGMLTMWPLVSVTGSLVRSESRDDKRALQELHAAAAMHGSLLHAYGVTRGAMARGSWYAATSSTWLTGSRFGRTTVWDPADKALRHLDLTKKDQRLAFRGRFEDSGLDWSKIESGDPVETNLANAVGWLSWGEHLGRQVDNAYWLTDAEKEIAEPDRTETVSPQTNDEALSQAQSTALAIAEEAPPVVLDERTLQPIMCNTCVIRTKCPKFKKDATCAFHAVAPVTGEDSATSVLNAAITIQLQRVQQGALIEKVEGGALSEIVGDELMRLAEMVAIASKTGNKRESLTLEGGPGVMEQFVKAIQGGGREPARFDVIDVESKETDRD